MNVSIVKMTGPELKKIYKSSGLNGDEFADRLGISRGGLYLLFKDKIVSEAIEIKINSDHELNRIRQLSTPNVKSGASENAGESLKEVSKPNYSPDLLDKTIFMLEQTFKLILDDNKTIKGLIETVKGDNDKIHDLAMAVKQDAAIYRSMVQQGIDQGAIKFIVPKK